MIAKIIEDINRNLSELFETAKIYGIAQSIIRKKGETDELLPALVDHTGEAKYVGIDDIYPMIMYHKTNSITSALATAKGYGGYGRDGPDQVNTYQNSLIVYLDRKKVKKLPDEIYLFIQSSFPQSLKIEPFIAVNIRFTSVILNGQQVFASEYQNTGNRLAPEKNLFAINYTVESIFKPGCFDKCL